ncbi:hypothetical protein [uncultured Cedecea sp.]|nr:hypothetical protein [uncultured Cedecea sp.]
MPLEFYKPSRTLHVVLPASNPPITEFIYAHRQAELGAYKQLELFGV